ncbi:MAG TPA: A24 family peptidase [Candidatus Limnocylindrales bacterium]|nr:A24 family peptidase [Candidatus Limnocylindrales bacterium]
MDPVLPAVFGLFGGLFGLAADRLAVRWPEHEGDGRRGVDWRTLALVVGGAAAFGALAVRWSQPAHLLVLGAYFAALLVLMATDLDQKLLPDVITLPLIPVALVVLLLGLNPLLEGKALALPSALAAAIGAPLLLAVTDRVLRGALGMGDLKLAVGLGLMSGLSRLFTGFLIASALSSVVIVALLLTKRIRLDTAIPFGPVLIAGGIIAALTQ